MVVIIKKTALSRKKYMDAKVAGTRAMRTSLMIIDVVCPLFR